MRVSFSEPFVRLAQWIENARLAGCPEPEAMSLATVSAGGLPSNRMVLLRGLSSEGLVFYTNYESRKGVEIGQNLRVAATLWWHEIQRQVRVEGSAGKISPEESDTYFAGRAYDSRISAAASPQSREISSREWLLERAEQVRAEGEVARPEHWGGYRIVPDYFEFWVGKPHRLHERQSYLRTLEGWQVGTLAP